MGEFKQLLPFGGKTFVECCVDNLLASNVDQVVVVTGHRHREVRDAIANRPVRFVHNADYEFGMSGSIKRGIEVLSTDVQACLVALVDQPQIGPNVVNQVIDAYKQIRSLVVVPHFGGRNGHPVLLDLSLREQILSMKESEGLRQVVRANSDRLTRIESSTDAVLTDFDWPDDYQRIKAQR